MTNANELWKRTGLDILKVVEQDNTISTNKMMTFRITINKYEPMLFILIPKHLTARLSLLYHISFKYNANENWICVCIRIDDRFCYSYERGISFPSTIKWFDVLGIDDIQLGDEAIIDDLKFLKKEYSNGNIHDVHEHYKVVNNAVIDVATIIMPK